MTSIDLRSTGKWILAGEHSVLRGCDALVFPLESRVVQMSGTVELCARNHGAIHFTGEGELAAELPSLFMAVLNRAFDLLREKNIQVRGQLHIKNVLPFGAGLGASASVCVLITNLLHQLGLVSEEERFPFARQLENIFHGESSGVDVAVSLVNRPIRFNREKSYSVFESQYTPLITLHYSGKRGVTRECIEVVQNKIRNDPIQGRTLDNKMETSVQMCEKAFQEKNLELLAQAIHLACEVYEEWGLIDPLSQSLIKKLQDFGAIAVKPTGSGLGGFLLALWPENSVHWHQLDCIPGFSSVE